MKIIQLHQEETKIIKLAVENNRQAQQQILTETELRIYMTYVRVTMERISMDAPIQMQIHVTLI